MMDSAIIGTPPANGRDELIAKGLLVQYQLPFPTKVPYWKLLNTVDPNKPGLPHDSRGGVMLPGNIAGAVIIILITGFRLFSRWRSRSSKLGWDDFFIFWAALAGVSWLILQALMITKGDLGKHSWDCTYAQQYIMQNLGHVNQKLFVIWACLSKISIACFNWRLTGRSSITWKWIHIFCLVMGASWGISMLSVLIFGCRPVVASGDLIVAGRLMVPGKPTDYKCYIKAIPFGQGLLGSHIVTDVVLLAIPIYIVYGLQIQKKLKLQAIVPLSVGALGVVGTILRYYYQIHYIKDDLLYNFKDQSDWGVIDTVVTICVTSLPACWGLVTRKFRLYSGTGRSKDSGSKGSNNMGPAGSPNHQARPRGLESELVTGLSENKSRSSISSHTLGDIEAQHHAIADKEEIHHIEDIPHSEDATHVESDEKKDNNVFTGYGIAMGHPNLRDDYEKRASQKSEISQV